MKACFILVSLQLRALKRKNSSLPISGTQYPNFLLPSSLTTLGKTGQQNEGVEFRRKPETPQAEPLRADGGRGHGSHRRPGYKPRLQRTQPPPDPGGEALARSPQAPEAKGDGTRAPLLPPPHEAIRRAGSAGSPRSALLPPFFPAPTDLETAMAARSRAWLTAGGGTGGPGCCPGGGRWASLGPGAPHPASAPPAIRGQRLSAAEAGGGRSVAPPGGAAAAWAAAAKDPRSAG